MTTKILLRPYLAKFILELYGKNNVVHLPSNTELSYWLKVFLTKQYESIPAEKDGMIAVDFHISENASETIGHTFPSAQFAFFNIVLNRYFNSISYTMMLHLVKEQKKSERAAAVALHTRFGFTDEEYTIEALRFNAKQRKKNFEEFFREALPNKQQLCIMKTLSR